MGMMYITTSDKIDKVMPYFLVFWKKLKEAEIMDTRSTEQSAENTWLHTCSSHVALRIGSHVSTSSFWPLRMRVAHYISYL